MLRYFAKDRLRGLTPQMLLQAIWCWGKFNQVIFAPLSLARLAPIKVIGVRFFEFHIAQKPSKLFKNINTNLDLFKENFIKKR